MTDPKAIDISPEAVADIIDVLRANDEYRIYSEAADLLSALSAARDEVMRERDEAKKQCAFWAEKAGRHWNRLKATEAQRDAVLAELARKTAQPRDLAIAVLRDCAARYVNVNSQRDIDRAIDLAERIVTAWPDSPHTANGEVK